MEEEAKISRRDMLKKAAIAGAVVWSAPVLSALPARAATTRPDPCQGNCINCPEQGSVPPCPRDPTNCYCFWKNGTQNCHCADLRPGSGFCDEYQTCTRNRDCRNLGRAYLCTSTCCDAFFGLEPICLAKCGRFSAAPKRASKGYGPRVNSR